MTSKVVEELIRTLFPWILVFSVIAGIMLLVALGKWVDTVGGCA